MRKPKKRWIVLGLVLICLATVPALLWVSLAYVPEFYRSLDDIPVERRKEEAERFLAQSLQLRNDIANEPRWEAVFTADEVNSWLAQDLVAYFADQIPAGVSEPRVAFEMGRIIVAFQLEEGPVRSVVWVVLRVDVPEGNTLALTLERIRAGVVPIPAERITSKITEHASRHGLEVRWTHDGDLPVARIAYHPNNKRRDVVLEQLNVIQGQIRLAGRSDRAQGAAPKARLPRRRTLQSTFPTRQIDQAPPPADEAESDPVGQASRRKSNEPAI